MRVVRHIICIAVLSGVCCFSALSLTQADIFALAQGSTELISSATTVVDAPEGAYLVFINRALHTDEEVLATWVDFFEGREVPIIWEDVSCMVAAGDTAGEEMALSYASRLAEHQMSVRVENEVLMVSKLEAHVFDVAILSQSRADALDVSALLADEQVEVVMVR